jgi:hypothetical protein
MVFGHKCVMCGKDANIHHTEDNEYHKEILNQWLCTKCNSAICDLKYVLYEMEKEEVDA